MLSVRSAFGTPSQTTRAVLIVLVTAAVWGGLTSVGQGYLPEDLRSFANAAGPWFVVVMGAIVVARPRPALAVVLGILGFVVMNQAYGVVSSWRDYAYGGGFSSIWNLIALVAGPAAGIAATWLRTSRPVPIALGTAAACAVLVGEGLYGLTVIGDTTSPVFWAIELGAGLALLAVTAALRLRTIAGVAVLVAASAVGAAMFYVAYRAL